jgi:hypothetical protein
MNVSIAAHNRDCFLLMHRKFIMVMPMSEANLQNVLLALLLGLGRKASPQAAEEAFLKVLEEIRIQRYVLDTWQIQVSQEK